MPPIPTPERVAHCHGGTGWWVWLCIPIPHPLRELRDIRVVWVEE
jgi:hypothetical protein